MENETICAFAPATIANVNVGFDTLGMALAGIGDKVELKPNGLSMHRIIRIDNHDSLPTNVNENSCTVVIIKMQEKLNSSVFVDVKIKKGFASGSGLGSSSASSAAAAFAYNQLLGKPFTTQELVYFAAEGERVACGTAHLDNVAPALLGGLVLIYGREIISLPLPEKLFSTSFFPNIEINTSSARSIISQQVTLATTSKQVAHMGAFVVALFNNDMDLIKSSMQDFLVEPYRKVLIPYFDEMREAAMKKGAITFGISGSGPSVFALSSSSKTANEILMSLENIYKGKGVETLSFTQQISKNNGAYLCNYDD